MPDRARRRRTAAAAAYATLACRLAEMARPAPCTDPKRRRFWLSPIPADQAEAAADCQRCPARQACADYAIAAGERFGVWGGLTPAERRDRRQERHA